MKRHFALLISAIIVFIDQIFKILALNNLKYIDSLPIIPDIFHFTYVENRGAAFGMLEGKKWILIGVTAIVILFAIVLVLAGKLDEDNHLLFSICVIIGGGVGNLIDRIYRNFVVDYIHLKVINFAVFNFADICVTLGTLWLLIYLLFDMKKGDTKGA